MPMAKWRRVVPTESANLGVNRAQIWFEQRLGRGCLTRSGSLEPSRQKVLDATKDDQKSCKDKTGGGRRGGGLPRWGHELLGL
jgi:hypothetical protein